MNPRAALAEALQKAGLSAAGAIAHHAGVTARQAANAITERPVATIPYLRIAAAIRFDPTPSLPHPFPVLSDFDFGLFSMGFRLRRYLLGQNERHAAKAIDASPSTVCRLEKGDAMFIGVVLRACGYIGLSPFGYFKILNSPAYHCSKSADVPRETSQRAGDLPGKAAAKIGA